MTISAQWSRPFSEAAEVRADALDYVLTEQAGRAVLDVVATIGGNSKLISRIILTPATSGSNLTHRVRQLNFAGSATDYVNATTPADSIAVNTASATEITLPDGVNLDTFFTEAGVARRDPTP